MPSTFFLTILAQIAHDNSCEERLFTLTQVESLVATLRRSQEHLDDGKHAVEEIINLLAACDWRLANFSVPNHEIIANFGKCDKFSFGDAAHLGLFNRI